MGEMHRAVCSDVKEDKAKYSLTFTDLVLSSHFIARKLLPRKVKCLYQDYATIRLNDRKLTFFNIKSW